MYTKEQIEKVLKSKGYSWFDGKKDYDLNIVGIRNKKSGDAVTNLFDDTITVSYKVNGKWVYKEWSITTDPGKKAVLEFHNKKGVAILAPGQYKGSHQLGKHKGQYDALVQKNNVKVYRDADKDLEFDKKVTDVGVFGINIHRSNPTTESTYVENWSEGCQVFKRLKDYTEFINICKEAVKVWGNSFTYTLIESTDIDNLNKKVEPVQVVKETLVEEPIVEEPIVEVPKDEDEA